MLQVNGYFHKLYWIKIQIHKSVHFGPRGVCALPLGCMQKHGWPLCLKATLQKPVPKNVRSCKWGDKRTVKRVQTVSVDPHLREPNSIEKEKIFQEFANSHDDE